MRTLYKESQNNSLTHCKICSQHHEVRFIAGAGGVHRFMSLAARATLSTTTALSATQTTKPVIHRRGPDVWAYSEETMKPIHGSNKPTSGPQATKELPKDHDIQLYGMATPNGVKASILLEEISDLKDVEYDAWYINLGEGDQFTSGFVEVNPNSKIPAILDLLS
jgi:GST-like protein